MGGMGRDPRALPPAEGPSATRRLEEENAQLRRENARLLSELVAAKRDRAHLLRVVEQAAAEQITAGAEPA